MTSIKSLAVFCGSNTGNDPRYAADAKALAKAIYSHSIHLIYGGAKVGLMGVLADTLLELGGQVTGVMPQSLVDIEVAHESLGAFHVVKTMAERKDLMAELSDGFIMLPGGAGSLDEFFEMMTWSQLSFHEKPCAILNSGGYYDHLLKFLDHSVSEGFIKTVHRDMIIVEEQAEPLIEGLFAYRHPMEKKWIKDDTRDPSK